MCIDDYDGSMTLLSHATHSPLRQHKVNTIWQQIHHQLAAIEVRNKRAVHASQQAYAARYVNAISRLTSEFYRQRDALLAHTATLRTKERSTFQAVIDQLHADRMIVERECKRLRVVVSRQSMVVRKYGAANSGGAAVDSEMKAVEREAGAYVCAVEEALKAKDVEIARLKKRLKEVEEGTGAARANGTARAGSPRSAGMRKMNVRFGNDVGAVKAGVISAQDTVASPALYRPRSGLRRASTGMPAVLPARAASATPESARRRATTASAPSPAFEYGARVPVLNSKEWLSKEGLQSALSTPVDSRSSTPGDVAVRCQSSPTSRRSSSNFATPGIHISDADEVTSFSGSHVAHNNNDDDKLLDETLSQLQLDHNSQVSTLTDDHTTTIHRLKLELAKTKRQYQQQLDNVKESARVVASKEAMSVVVARQEHVLKFARVFFGKDRKGVREEDGQDGA